MTPAERRSKTWKAAIRRSPESKATPTTPNGCPEAMALAANSDEMVQNLAYIEELRRIFYSPIKPLDRTQVLLQRGAGKPKKY